ncbi:MAG: LacI family DNA-binding transcriptional regulator [Chloroflexota bacterium]
MPVTLQDIATRVGVSPSTVSRALNGQGRMKEDTRKYIKSIAEEMGYVPNFLAQSLHDTKTRMIGIVITSVADPFTSQLIEGIEQVADSADYTLFLGASKFDIEKEIDIILKFYQRRVDGIIVQTSHLQTIADPRIETIDVPIVFINNESISNAHNVTIDSRAEAKKAVDYLFSIGHRKIGFVNPPTKRHSNERRLLGYQDAHEAQGQVVNPAYIFRMPMLSDYETGREALNQILDTDVTAVFCYDDMIALGLMNACRERGIHVPDDLSVMGFDDIAQASQFYPTLTTIHQPALELGRSAMTLIQDEPDEFVNHLLECELIVRDSTKPL